MNINIRRKSISSQSFIDTIVYYYSNSINEAEIKS